jgi:FdhD protein
MQQSDFSRTVLLCSGRFSVEMVIKAAAAGIPIYCAPAAASIEAMELAQQLDMSLCGRLSSDSVTVYSAPWRITAP